MTWQAAFLEYFAKLVARHEALAGGDRNAHRFADLEERVDIFGRHGLFAEIRAELFDRVDVGDRHGGIGAAVEVDHDIDAVAERETELLHQGGEFLDGSDAHQRLGVGHEDDFHGRVAVRHDLAGEVDQRRGVEAFVDRVHVSAAQVRVHADAVAHGAAEQFVDRDAERLAQDVPAGLLDAGDRAHADHAQSPEGLPVELLIEVLDAGRVLADQHGLEILDGADDGARFPFERRFAPAGEAVLIGFHFDEHPVAHLGVDHQRAHVCDLHETYIMHHIIRYVPLQSGNGAGGIERGGGASSSGESTGHDRAVAIAAGSGGGSEPELSGLFESVRRVAEDGDAGARGAGSDGRSKNHWPRMNTDEHGEIPNFLSAFIGVHLRPMVLNSLLFHRLALA